MDEGGGKASWIARAAAALSDWRAGMRRAPSATADDVSWIEAGDLSGRLDHGSGPIVVDVRGPDEFRGALGHIPGARNIPLDQLPGRAAELAAFKGCEVTLVCRTQMRSAKAAGVLRDAGFSAIRVLRGGMEQWITNGLPVEDRAVQPQP